MTDSKGVNAKLVKLIERAVGSVVLRSYQTLTSATPVKTGFARSKWHASTGSPSSPGGQRPGDEAAATALAASLFAANSQAAAAIAAGYSVKLGPVYLANNTRYLRYLNEGTSAQAPAMFVEQAVATAVAKTREDLAR